MATPQQIQRALDQVHDRATFLQDFLVDTLEWPIDQGVEDPDDITYAWSEEELRTQGLTGILWTPRCGNSGPSAPANRGASSSWNFTPRTTLIPPTA